MLKTARKQDKNAEGRMPLAEHLRELRNRLLKSVLGVLVVTVVAAVFYKELIDFLLRPILDSVGCADRSRRQANGGVPCADMTVNGLIAPFSIALKVSLMSGVVLASPIWLYQLWAFMAPGLHTRERKYALAFVGAGVPLFLGGAVLAYVILPQTATVLLGFTPQDTENLLPVDDYLDLVTRMVIVFGLAFELPLLLVLLNITKVLTGKRLAGWWRGMLMGIALFSAFATPTGDPLTMLSLAAPIALLCVIALVICLLNDRRRARNDPDAGLGDDEASPLGLCPQDVDAAELVYAAPHVTAQAGPDQERRLNGHDDIT
ncbi:twin-arginine translocase subunit TatC [Streptomyces sp. DG2A-72]|uniref:twin-arginine translocase subunit TatC n=2 Tax=Streptomyces sp. DG2A-72 TaxID=3051386 RepID=UPI00265BF5AE|nr:twin-arginine translocase subunit TatC [Streptomyces sp. DG2A-72]MDO0939445.1 twin-arginine translocase subunit TatC [Streptomyces sp. DG2A-72]